MNPADAPGTPPAQQPKNGLAIASLILGILSITPCLGLLSAIAAIITGHIAHSRARKDPLQFGGKGMAIGGFVLGYISLLVLPALLLPALSRAKEKAQTIRCVMNLKEVGIAARMYADAHNHVYPSDLKQIAQTVGDPKVFKCPADTKATAATNLSTLSDANISYEIVEPGMTPSGDNDPTKVYIRCPIHNNQLMGDGSVIQQRTNRPPLKF